VPCPYTRARADKRRRDAGAPEAHAAAAFLAAGVSPMSTRHRSLANEDASAAFRRGKARGSNGHGDTGTFRRILFTISRARPSNSEAAASAVICRTAVEYSGGLELRLRALFKPRTAMPR
jgi:hypothetical protein